MDLHRAGVVGAVAVLPLLLSEAIGSSHELAFWVLPALVAPALARRSDPRWRLMAQGAWWSVVVASAFGAHFERNAAELMMASLAGLGSAAALVLSRHDVAEAQRRAGRAPRDFGATLATSTVVVSVLGMWLTAGGFTMLSRGARFSELVVFLVGTLFLGAAWLIASGRVLGLAMALCVPMGVLVMLTLSMAFRSEPVIIDIRPVLLVPFAIVAAPMLPLLLALLPRDRRPHVPRRVRLGAKWLALAACLFPALYAAVDLAIT